MNETTHSMDDENVAATDVGNLKRRLYRGMCVTVAVAVLASALFASWRVTSGLLLGGLLSLFNYHWLSTSVVEIVAGVAAPAEQMRQRITVRFVLRYFIVAAIVCAVTLLDIASLPAMLAGLCAFVVALMIEASAQMYAAIARREKF
jgi:hypothetical protein